MATAGRTVTFSALTVAISIAGLLVFEPPILRAFGAAGVAVIVVAVLSALTLMPALLALAGRRLIRPSILDRVPGLRTVLARTSDVQTEEGVFSRLTARVQRRPWWVLGGTLVAPRRAGHPARAPRAAQLDHRAPARGEHAARVRRAPGQRLHGGLDARRHRRRADHPGGRDRVGRDARGPRRGRVRGPTDARRLVRHDRRPTSQRRSGRRDVARRSSRRSAPSTRRSRPG